MAPAETKPLNEVLALCIRARQDSVYVEFVVPQKISKHGGVDVLRFFPCGAVEGSKTCRPAAW